MASNIIDRCTDGLRKLVVQKRGWIRSIVYAHLMNKLIHFICRHTNLQYVHHKIIINVNNIYIKEFTRQFLKILKLTNIIPDTLPDTGNILHWTAILQKGFHFWNMAVACIRSTFNFDFLVTSLACHKQRFFVFHQNFEFRLFVLTENGTLPVKITPTDLQMRFYMFSYFPCHVS